MKKLILFPIILLLTMPHCNCIGQEKLKVEPLEEQIEKLHFKLDALNQKIQALVRDGSLKVDREILLKLFKSGNIKPHNNLDSIILNLEHFEQQLSENLKNQVDTITFQAGTIDVKDIINIPDINLDTLLKELDGDSNDRKKGIVIISKRGDKNDTLFTYSREGKSIHIRTKKPDPILPEDYKDYIEIDDEVRRSMEVKKDDDDDNDDDGEKKPRKQHFFSHNDFSFLLGFNNWVNAPQAFRSIGSIELKPFASRFIALSLRRNIHFGHGLRTEWAVSLGSEVAWYNYVFEQDTRVRYENRQVRFITGTENLKRSKLVVPYINLPVMLNIGVKKGYNIGVGGYVGYRIGGYSKEKSLSDETKKHSASFGLNNTTAGLSLELGFRGAFTIFGRYELTEQFKDNQRFIGNNSNSYVIGFRVLNVL